MTVLKLLKVLKTRIAATKFTFPKYFKLNNNLLESEESDSENDDDPRNRQQRSMTPIPRVPQTQPVVKVKPEIIRQPNLNDFASLTAEDSEMTAIFRSTTQASSSVTASTSQLNNSSLRPATPMSADRPMTPAMRRVLSETAPQIDRSATPFQNQTGRVQCQAITAKGAQCRNAAAAGYNKCRVHNYN